MNEYSSRMRKQRGGSWLWPFGSADPVAADPVAAEPVAAEPVAAEPEPKKASWWPFSGGARKSRKAQKPKGRLNVFVKEFKMVNGKVLVNREMHCVANTRSRKLKCRNSNSRKGRRTLKH